MPVLVFRCPACKAALRISDPALTGKLIRCPKCSTGMIVPRPGGEKVLPPLAPGSALPAPAGAAPARAAVPVPDAAGPYHPAESADGPAVRERPRPAPKTKVAGLSQTRVGPPSAAGRSRAGASSATRRAQGGASSAQLKDSPPARKPGRGVRLAVGAITASYLLAFALTLGGAFNSLVVSVGGGPTVAGPDGGDPVAQRTGDGGVEAVQIAPAVLDEAELLGRVARDEELLADCRDQPPRRDIPGQALALKVYGGHKGALYDLDYSADGKWVASASADGTSVIWDVAAEKPAQVLRHEGVVAAVAFAPDGSAVATGSHDGTVRVWDLAGKLLQSLPAGGKVQALAFSPGTPAKVAAVTAENRLLVWEALLGTEVLNEELRGGPPGSGAGLAFTWDGSVLVVGADREVRLWDLRERGAHEARLRTADPVSCLAVARDGRAVAVGTSDLRQPGLIYLWDPAGDPKAEKVSRIPSGLVQVKSLQFTPDDEGLVAAGTARDSQGDAVVVYDRASRSWTRRLEPRFDPGQKIALSPGGRLLISSLPFRPTFYLCALDDFPGPEATLAVAELEKWGCTVRWEGCGFHVRASPELTDRELASVGQLPRVTSVDLSGAAKVTDRGLQHLQGLENLRSLDLTGTGVTDTAVAALRQALPKAEVRR